MTVRPGSFYEILSASQTFGGASGRILPINNSAYGVLTGVRITWVTTATVGNRFPRFRVLDSVALGSNILYEIRTPFQLTAAATWVVNFAGGAPQASGGQSQTNPIPVECSIPPFSQFQIFDDSNIDPNDTFTSLAFGAM